MNGPLNVEQVKSAIRWFIATFGALIAGIAIGRKWVTADQAASALHFLSDPQVLAIIASVIAGIWGLFVHSQPNAIKVAAAIPNTPEVSAAKVEMAAATPDNKVAKIAMVAAIPEVSKVELVPAATQLAEDVTSKKVQTKAAK